MTLIDSLDMLAVVGDFEEFRSAVETVVETVKFDRDVRVSVFETTIRIIGGLLSAHMLASPEHVGLLPDYEQLTRPTNRTSSYGALLGLAIDVGERLLVAFDTPTGIPVHRVNLKYGQISGEKQETCPFQDPGVPIVFSSASKER